MNLRKFLSAVICLVLVLSLTACGKSSEQTSASETKPEQNNNEKKDVTVTVWHQYMPEVQTALEEAYRDFTEETGIKVQFIKQEDFDKKIENGIQTGELPDLLLKAHDWTGKLVVMGGILPIDEYAEKNVLSNLMDNSIDGFRYKGKLYGIPAAMETVTLIYNKDLIKEPPKNTDELLQKTKELTGSGKYGFLIPPKDAYFNSAFIYGAGGGYLDSNGKPILDKAEILEAMRILQELAQYYPKDLDHSTVSQLFKEGKAAMMVNGPWEIPGIKEAKINYGLAPIPAVTKTGKSSPFMGIQGIMMTSRCKDKEAAASVMNFFGSEKVSKAMAKAAGYIPANKKVKEDSEILANQVIAGFMKQTETAIPMVNMPEMAVMWGPLDGYFQEIVIMKQSPEIVAKTYQQKAEEQIKSMK